MIRKRKTRMLAALVTIFYVLGVVLALDAVIRRDYPMVQGAVLLVALSFAVINLVVDLLYAYLDPRVKY